VAVLLHRITRVYGLLGVVVPVVGIVLAVVQGRMAEVWINIAMLLTAAAGLLLALVIYPRQKAALAEPDGGARLRSLAMYAGIYNLLWAIVVVLMIVRPGAD
jgi:zinc transporter ZupT